MYAKLSVHSDIELVTYAVEKGWIHRPEANPHAIAIRDLAQATTLLAHVIYHKFDPELHPAIGPLLQEYIFAYEQGNAPSALDSLQKILDITGRTNPILPRVPKPYSQPVWTIK